MLADWPADEDEGVTNFNSASATANFAAGQPDFKMQERIRWPEAMFPAKMKTAPVVLLPL